MAIDQTTPKVGKLLTGNEARDAIHFALAPVTAAVTLVPGRHVGYANGMAVTDEPHIGIVDPFLPYAVEPGQKFWLFLYPETITSLRHAWTHPAFAAAAPPEVAGDVQELVRTQKVQASKDWIKDYANHSIYPYLRNEDEAYTTLLEDLKNNRIRSYGVSNNSRNDYDDDLWMHLAIIGIIVNPNELSYFCSC